ncbi:MAG: RNA polymerase sigma factor [Ruminococcaceae bacterium]|nr:RNA polymerase sigma factor [Oscillospiraceae bacterium]
MTQIEQLLIRRDERALELLKQEYGTYCRTILYSLLRCESKTDEAMNDLWLRIWSCDPPPSPVSWKAYLARTARNLGIDYIRRDHTRIAGTAVIEELSHCLPDPKWEDRMDMEDLRGLLNDFVRALGDEERQVFLLRYWYGANAAEIAAERRCSQARINSMLWRIRKRLRTYLLKEGYEV